MGNWRDTAQICINGHIINYSSEASPQFNKRFCTICGSRTITACEKCKSPIQGKYHIDGALTVSAKDRAAPSFCHNCGEPYPWTESALKAAREMADELDALNEEEKIQLKDSFNDLIRETPQTTVSASRFKRLITKAGKGASEAFNRILINVLTETAKKLIFPS